MPKNNMFIFGKKEVNIREVLTNEELNLVLRAMASYPLSDVNSMMLLSAISNGQKQTLSRSERNCVLDAVDYAIEKLRPVDFIGQNGVQLEILSSARRKL